MQKPDIFDFVQRLNSQDAPDVEAAKEALQYHLEQHYHLDSATANHRIIAIKFLTTTIQDYNRYRLNRTL